MKIKLKWRLTISYLIISILLVLSLYIVSNYFFQKQFQRYVIDQQNVKNKEIVQIVTNAYSESGQAPSLNFFEEFGDTLLDQHLILSVYDNDNKQLFCMACYKRSNCLHTINNMKKIMEDIYPNFKGEYVEEQYEIIKNDEILGYVKIGFFGPFFYSDNDQNFIKTFNNIFIGIAIISFIISVILGLIMANTIEKPIKKVIKRTKLISEGDYSRTVDIKTNTPEITELADSVNVLANNLKNQLIIKKQMAGDLAHEFLTPLTTIQNGIDAIIDGVFEASPERLQNLKLEVERLARMVYEIDNLVTNTDDNLKLNITKFNLSDIIKTILKNFESEIYSKNIKINFKNKKCDIYADKDKISQVIINLISNAIKYTNDNGNIIIDISQTKNNILFTIADDGVGIKKEDLPFIFEYLYKVDKSRSREKGSSGIGLYVVKNIVEAHNGTIEVTSKVDAGSKFTVTLPIIKK